MTDLLLILMLLALLGMAVFIWRRTQRPAEDGSMLLLQNQVQALTTQNTQQMEQLRQALQVINQQVSQSLSAGQQSVDERLKGANEALQNVHKQLSVLDSNAQQIFNVGKDIASLQDILQAPKLRGGLGEYLLEELLAQVLPARSYAIQHTFKGNETVDAIIRLESGMVPIDAKFPLENFRRLAESEDDAEKHRKQFLRDVKKHIDAIATKYIRPDEGTFDFALMYIPAENVYYEVIIRDENENDDKSVFHHALAKKVIPVSPASFYAYLQTVLLGLKGLQVEQNARGIMDHLSRLRRDFGSFEEDFRILGSHLDNAHSKYGDSKNRLNKINAKVEEMDRLKEADVTAPLDQQQSA
jgi:DNA recombination protein RmuC